MAGKNEADYRRECVGLAGLFPLKTGGNTIGSAATNDTCCPVGAGVGRRFVLDGERSLEPRTAWLSLKGPPSPRRSN